MVGETPQSKGRKLNIVADFNTIPERQRIERVPPSVKPLSKQKTAVFDLQSPRKFGAQEILPAEQDFFNRQRAQKKIGREYLKKN